MEATLRSEEPHISDIIDEYRKRLPHCSSGHMALVIMKDQAVPDEFARTALYRALARTIGDYTRQDGPDGMPRRVPTGEHDEHGMIQVEFDFATKDEAIEGGIIRAANIEASSRRLARYVNNCRRRWRAYPTFDALMEMGRERMDGVPDEPPPDEWTP